MDGAEGGAGQIGADEDALDLYRAAFELGGLEGDDDCGAVLRGDLLGMWHIWAEGEGKQKGDLSSRKVHPNERSLAANR